MKLTYVGPHDAVDLDLPFDGADKFETVTVARGQSHAFSPEDAARLLEQPSNWQPSARGAKTPSAAQAVEDDKTVGETAAEKE